MERTLQFLSWNKLAERRGTTVSTEKFLVVIETIGTELGRLDEVRKIIQEFSEIIPGSGADPQQPSPPGVA